MSNEISELSRTKMQDLAMTAIFDFLVYQHMGEVIDVEGIVTSLTEVSFEESDYFLKSVLIMSIKHYDEIVAAFNAKMAKMSFDRLNRVEQAILMLSYSHYYYFQEKTDKAVVINVAIKLANTYLLTKDRRFVNAILDNVLQER